MKYLCLMALSLMPVLVTAAPNCNYKVISIEGVKTLKNSEPTMSFKDGRVFGKASCNTYQASFSEDKSKIRVGQGMSTLMACYPNEIMQQEQHFLGVLPLVTSESKTKDGAIFLDNKYNKLLEVVNCK